MTKVIKEMASVRSAQGATFLNLVNVQGIVAGEAFGEKVEPVLYADPFKVKRCVIDDHIENEAFGSNNVKNTSKGFKHLITLSVSTHMFCSVSNLAF